MDKAECKRVLRLMELYVTGDVTPAEVECVRDHIEECDMCREEYEAIKLLIDGIRITGTSVPQEVDERMVVAIKSIAQEVRKGNSGWLRWMPLTLAVPVGVYLLAKVGLPLDKSFLLTGVGLNLLSLLLLPFVNRNLVRE